MRSLIPALLAFTAAAPALDTPLVLRPLGNGNANNQSALVVNPANGVITYYNATTQSLEIQGSAQFLFDLDQYDKMINGERGGSVFSMLRVGSANWKPNNTESLLEQLHKASAKVEASIREAENTYWGKDHEYDGIVRAAWNGDTVMLCIPSKHTVMFYDTSSQQKISLIGWQNYGPLLMMPSGFNTNPTPQEIYRNLPKLQQDKLADEAKKAEEALGNQPKETPASDAWVGAATNNAFLLFDIANNRLIVFESNGKNFNIRAVRNIGYELKLPPRQNYRSTPDAEATLQAFVGTHNKDLAAAGYGPFTKDPYMLRALVETVTTKTKKGGGGSGLQANMFDDKVVLDFTSTHKLASYNLLGTSLDLISIRDYSTDLAVSALAEALNDRAVASQVLAQAEKNAKSHAAAMRALKYALKLDPGLVDNVSKNTRFVPELSKNEGDWPTMIDTANKDKDEAAKRMAGIAELAKKMKEEDERLLNPPKEPKDANGGGAEQK